MHWNPSKELVQRFDEYESEASLSDWFDTAPLRQAIAQEIESLDGVYPSSWQMIEDIEFSLEDHLGYVYAHLGDLYLGTIKDDGGGRERYLSLPAYLRRPTKTNPHGTLSRVARLGSGLSFQTQYLVASAIISDRVQALFFPFDKSLDDDIRQGYVDAGIR